MAHLHMPKSGLLSESRSLPPSGSRHSGLYIKADDTGNTKAVILEFQGKVTSPHCFSLKFLDIQGKELIWPRY